MLGIESPRKPISGHEAIVGHCIREVTIEMESDEVQVVVLEIVESAKVKHDQNRHNLTVGHAGCASATWCR